MVHKSPGAVGTQATARLACHLLAKAERPHFKLTCPCAHEKVCVNGNVFSTSFEQTGDLEGCVSRAFDQGADMIVSSGGVSMGDRDLIKPLMERSGQVPLRQGAHEARQAPDLCNNGH